MCVRGRGGRGEGNQGEDKIGGRVVVGMVGEVTCAS